MSTRAPGVYKATVRGVPDTTVMVDGAGFGVTVEKFANGNTVHGPEKITDARPLIVVDLHHWHPTRVAEAAKDVRESSFRGRVSADFLLDLLAQVEAQTKPPRIPEPGIWGVVEATHDGRRHMFVHHDTAWIAPGYQRLYWPELIDPTLIREGVTS